MRPPEFCFIFGNQKYIAPNFHRDFNHNPGSATESASGRK